MVGRGVRPVEAHLLKSGSGESDEATLRLHRGFPDDEWAAARAGMIERGWLDAAVSARSEEKDGRYTAVFTLEPGPRVRVRQALLEGANLVAHLLPQLRVEVGEGLVKKQDARLVDDGPRQGHPLLLTARELVGRAVGHTAQAHHLKHPLDPNLDFLL